jgi:putative DNA primase/helicase
VSENDKTTTVSTLSELHAKLTQPSNLVQISGSVTTASATTVPVVPAQMPVPPPPANGGVGGAPAVDVAPAQEAPAPAKAKREKKTDTAAPDPLPFKVIRGKDSTVPKPCLANVIAFLREHSTWVGVLAYDEFTNRIVVKREPPGWPHPKKGQPWTDADDAYTACWFQRNRMMISTKLAREAVDVVARENSFHPVRDYLTRLRWDRKPRLETWLSKYLGAEDLPVNRAFGKMWMTAAVARVFQPGVKVDYTLVLEGEQGLKKSTVFSILASDDWFTDNIEDIHDKDARIDLKGKWIVEFSELDKFKGKSLESVKAFLSVRMDHYRPPYETRSGDHPRQCVFAGSTNRYDSLNDETGNRRFWPVRCQNIDLDSLRRDRDQLWAEAYYCYKQGEKWWPEENTDLNSAILVAQAQRYQPGADDDLIADWIENLPAYDVDDPTEIFLDPYPELAVHSRRTRVRVREIMKHVLHAEPGGKSGREAEQEVLKWLRYNKWELDYDRRFNFWCAPGTKKRKVPPQK